MNYHLKTILLSFSIVLLLFGCVKKEEEPAIIVDSAISADGVSIAYEVRGKGEPAIVFIHGWCCDRTYWEAQLPYFAQKYKVVTIDLAGHGESGLDRKEWTMGAFGEDVIAVINKLNLDQVVLVGHSMGGPVILEAARRMPKRVIGLVGVDTLQNFEFKFTQEQIDEFFTPLRSNFVESSRNFVRSMFTPTSDSALVEKIANDMSSAPPDVGIGALEGYVDFQNNEIIQVLKEVKVPITCINSDKDPTNVEINQHYAPSFKAMIMSGVGHFNMMEDPETFNRLLEESVQEFVQKAKSK
ncbi:MAG: alpha/beta hydrolase [Candidatus Aminicenantes bacterium]|nr:MAG: alpha/beta hydrolase [Candidatus Aminicenantes bacterium]